MTSFEDKKCSKMVDALKGLDDNELLSIFRQANGYSNDFDFCDGWDIEDLANDIIDMYASDKYSDVLPREIEDVLYLFKQYEEYGWEGEGKYRIVYEDDTHSMWFEFGEDDFDSYSEWLDEAEVDGINKRVEFFE